ncbi:hypothetical protein [Mammaliicoccus vitulinus]|uniref:hypothetical protein n=1 Tax=Mammaliicoccus vitulinus TaxID=71237 RepID=UPI003F968B81
MTLWIIISIILAINSMWMLKLNKDLIERNEELIAMIVIKDMQNEEDEECTHHQK